MSLARAVMTRICSSTPRPLMATRVDEAPRRVEHAHRLLEGLRHSLPKEEGRTSAP